MSMAQQPYSPVTVGITNSGTLSSDNLLSVSVTGNNNNVYQTVAAVSPSKLISRIEFGILDPIESFTGREDILVQLHQAIQENKSKGKVTVLSQTKIIVGMGGVGKTETIRKYVHTHKHLYGHILWINAETFSEAKGSFIKIAKLCHLDYEGIDGNPANRQTAIQDIYDFLCQKPCLVIFDNAESMGTVNGEGGIRPFLPSTVKTGWENPAIIVTSRNRDWKESLVEISGFTDDECYKLLISQLKFENTGKNRDYARQITFLCEGLPLVVQQVIAVIRDETEEREAMGQPGFTMCDFLSEYNEGGKDYTDKQPADSPVGASAYEIFRMSFRKLEVKANGKLALEILKVMSILNSDNIPTRLLTSLMDTAEERDVPKALSMLHKQNLITRFEGFYKIHRVTQRVVSLWNTQIPAASSSEGHQFGFGNSIIMAQIVPRFQDYLLQMPADDKDTYEILENGVRVASLIPESKTESKARVFLVKLGGKLDQYGKHSDAEVLFLKALKITPAKFTSDVSDAKCCLALSYSRQGKYDKAIEKYRDVIRTQEKKFGHKHRNTYFTKNQLANVYANKGDHEIALKLHQEVVAHLELWKPTHSQTLAAKHNLANSLRHQKNYLGAAKLYAEVLENRIARLGHRSKQTLSTKFHLANCFTNLGRQDEAIDLYHEVIEGREVTLGLYHPDTLFARHSLARELARQGKVDSAVEVYEGVLKVRMTNLGPNHPHTLATKHNLANVHAEHGRHHDAIALYVDVLPRRLAIHGIRHRDTLCTKNNLGWMYLKEGRNDEAVELSEDVLRHRKDLLGPDHSDTLVTQGNLADALSNLGRYEDAIKLYEDIVKRMKTTLGANHPETLSAKEKLANTVKLNDN